MIKMHDVSHFYQVIFHLASSKDFLPEVVFEGQKHHSIQQFLMISPSPLRKMVLSLHEDLRPFFLKEREISLKIVEWNDVFDPQKLPPVRNLWMKPNGKLPDKNEIHHAFLSYVSDSGLLAPCLYPHGLSYMSPNLMMASLG